jgi:photosystem II stability/assembly factor-like uncharacterized protein
MNGGEGFVVASFGFDPSSNDVFAGTTIGLFRSSDRGITWEDKDLLGGSMPGGMVFDPVRKGTLYVASADGLYVSSDRGSTWKDINPNGRTFSVRGLTARQKPFTLYVINEEGLFASHDRGASWNALTDERDDLSAVAFEPPSTLHVAANGAHYLRSVDDGKTWETTAKQWPHFTDFFFSGDSAYAASSGAMWRSTDSGKSWSAWKTAEELPVRSIVPDPKKHEVLWAPSLRSGIMVSVDGGTSWAERNLPPPAPQMQASASNE